jgi:UDP-glucose 4-epimerase
MRMEINQICKFSVPSGSFSEEMSEREKSKILITGVAGFIGSNLAVRLLREGYDVVGIDNLAYGLRENIPAGVDFHRIDIRDRGIGAFFGGVDAVFHLAAKNCIADCQADPVETAEINVAGTVNVFEASRKAGVRKIIYAESSALYEGSDVYPTPESEVKPESFYAVSKLASMYFAEAYQRYFGSGSTHHSSPITGHRLCFTALRYFCVYGPVQDYRRTIPPVMSAFIIKLLKGERPTIYGTGEKRRDFIYVDDVNDFHLICLRDNRSNGKTYNIGSGTNDSVLEILGQISKLLGITAVPVFKDDLPGEARVTLADISAAKALGWLPRTSLESGLERAVEYIRREMTLGRVP